jgi:hypothetical protein
MKFRMSALWYTMAATTLALLVPVAGRAQAIVQTALGVLSAETVHLEYSDSSKLRNLPDYASLRERYLGPRLKELEASLAQLDIEEGSIDEVVLGWRLEGSEAQLCGVASGRFDPQAVSAAAARRGLRARPVGENKIYCLGEGADHTCVAIRDPAVGFFGPLSSLTAMLKGEAGLESNTEFTRLVEGADHSAPIWGVAKGRAVADWFRNTMPGQENTKLDWNTAFQGVNGLTYSVETGNDVRLAMRLDCVSPGVAASVRQLLEGLRLVQRMAWQSQNPLLPNPYESLVVDSQNSEVSLKVTTPYAALAGIRRGSQ